MTTTDESKSESFYKIIRDFTVDLIRTFPELKDNGLISEDLIQILEGNECDTVFEYCKMTYPSHFFNILYKNEDMFNSEILLLPGIDFSVLWKSNISDNTKNVMWKYLQLILFSVISETGNAESFGDAAKLFEAINEEEFSAKIEETFNEFTKLCSDVSGISAEDLPNQEEVENHLKGIFSGKIGTLAKDIAEEVASELNIEEEGITDVKDVFKKLIKNPQKLMDLAKKVGEKLDTKIKSGEIKESELLEEASKFMGNMKNMPGGEQMKDLLAQFGLNNMSKAQTGAMKTEMSRKINMSKQQERMRAELERRNLEKAKKLLEEQQNLVQQQSQPQQQVEAPQKTKRNKKK